TQYASGLFYYYQSGALNEAFSDIFGELIDLTNGRGNDGPGVRWFVGEDSSLGALRNMADPPALGGPDKVSSPYWACDFGFSDNGGVHSNSGVLNKAAYLITDGSTFNGYAITGLGIDKAAAIFYELSENLLTSASDYLDVYDRLPQACYNLVGSNGITDADCQEVVKVVQATEMDHIPTLCGLEEAPLCPDGLACTDLFYDDLENAGSGNWVSAALLGQDAWYYPQNGHPYSGFDATYATSGTTNFWGYDQPSRGDYVIALTRDIALPADTAAYLRFNHSYQFEVYAGRYCDGGMVEYSLDGGLSWLDAGALFDANGYNGQITTSYDNPLQGRNAFVGTSYGYTSSRLHLSALAGQSVRFRFRLATDTGGEHYGWFVDDIRIYSATAGSSPSSTPTPTNTATETSIATLTETETPAPTATYTATASATSTATATATATAIPAYFSISINNAAIYTNSTEVMLTLTAPVGTVAMQVSNDGGFAGASWESFVPSKVWTITSYGAYTLPRTVYARFRDGAGAVSATYQDDIIFDPVPPSGAVRIVPGDAVVAAEAGRVLLQLSASDEVSGVGAMLISNRADFAGATWQQYQPSLAWTLDASGIVYARYRDNAGNQSPVYSARSVGSVRVFVPVVQR
ncbi:MAG: M4 family metallopeptidase, partial [Anaerolineae bacterium]